MPLKVYSGDEFQMVDDPKKSFADHMLIKAAGGATVDEEGRILLIFRRGKWDLPKGKMEDNEPTELCAEREVKEETGLNALVLRKPLIVTYHTYVEEEKSILKETSWFLFDAPGMQKLDPQTKEDITKAEWVTKQRLGEYTSNMFQLVIEVLHSAGF